MNLSHYHWQAPIDTPEVDGWIQQMQDAGANYSPAFLRLCRNRGLTTLAEIQSATQTEPQLFHDAYLLYDMDRAIDRLRQAVAQGEKILIYGDYDADGITSTLILLEALEQIGAEVTYYLPNRHTDGYGPNQEAYAYFIQQQGIQVILTCDNGVAGFEAIAYAQSQGVDVIVSDHHEIQSQLPEAYAIVHPRHPAGQYPFGDLSGAGVALKIATALLGEIPIESIELAAIGTVADMVALTDENRTIVMSGLKLMADTQRIGLRLLLEQAKVDFSQLTVDTLGFIIGPRLNAIGRLDDPQPALEFLRTMEDEVASQLLHLLNQKNDERKKLVDRIMHEVECRLQSITHLPSMIMETDATWSAGVVGIVASRLSEKYHRPAIILQTLTEQGTYKGSGRSIEGINLFQLLSEQGHLMTHFGGHQQAAGLTVKAEHYDLLKANLITAAQAYQDVIEQKPIIQLDLQLTLAELSTQLVAEIESLGPFGMANPKPIIGLESARISQVKYIGTDQQHVKAKLKSSLSDQPSQVDLIAFNARERFIELGDEQVIMVVGHLEVNEWQDQKNLQVRWIDFGIEGPLWIDCRSVKEFNYFLEFNRTMFVFQHSSFQKQMAQRLKADCKGLTYQDLNNHERLTDLAQYHNLVIMEPPAQLELLEDLLGRLEVDRIYLRAYIQGSKYLSGLPTREEFKRVYLWSQKQVKQPLELRTQLDTLSQQLKINLIRLKVIFAVFFEAKFVKIEAGWMTPVIQVEPAKIDLMQMPSLLAYQAAMASEALLVYQSLSEIRTYFEDKRSK